MACDAGLLMPTITPEQLAKAGTEISHQKALFCWAALNMNDYPELKYMYHIPNGGFRNLKEAANLKAAGVKMGVPDIHLPLCRKNYAGLFIELKRPESVGKKRGTVRQEQDDWREYLNNNNYLAIVCYGWQDAVKVLKGYLE